LVFLVFLTGAAGLADLVAVRLAGALVGAAADGTVPTTGEVVGVAFEALAAGTRAAVR
jgi:hypothetical protein